MIVVAGEALVDLIVAPDGGLTAVPGGGPYNAARALGRLGADVTFLGVLGDDRFGALLRDGLSDSGVVLGCPVPTPAPSTLAVAQLKDGGSPEYRFYLEGTSVPMLSAREAWQGLPREFRALHVGTLGLVVEPTGSVLQALVEQTAAEHIVMLDPNCRPAAVPDRAAFRRRIEHLLGYADVVKVSDEDVAFLYPDGGFEDAAAAVTARGGVVLLTCGSGPVTVMTGDGEDSFPSPAGQVVDTVGAGDIFGATALWALLDSGMTKGQPVSGAQALAAARTASVAAFLACQRAGAEPPYRRELDAALTAA